MAADIFSASDGGSNPYGGRTVTGRGSETVSDARLLCLTGLLQDLGTVHGRVAKDKSLS